MRNLGEAPQIARITNVSSGSGGVILITTATAHGLSTGHKALIAGVEGTTEANGEFTVTHVSSTSFSLNSTTFANTYVADTGAVFTSASLTIKAGVDAATSLVVTLSYVKYANGVRISKGGLVFLLPDLTAVTLLKQEVGISYELELITAKNPDSAAQSIYLELVYHNGTTIELKRMTGIAQYEEGQWIKGFPNINAADGSSRTAGGAIDPP